MSKKLEDCFSDFAVNEKFPSPYAGDSLLDFFSF